MGVQNVDQIREKFTCGVISPLATRWERAVIDGRSRFHNNVTNTAIAMTDNSPQCSTIGIQYNALAWNEFERSEFGKKCCQAAAQVNGSEMGTIEIGKSAHLTPCIACMTNLHACR
jgi:hypothetical protein